MEKIKEGESQKRADAGARKSRKVAIHSVFRMICGSGGPKGNLPKAAGADPSGQMRDEKVHAAVARSTFPSQKCQKRTISDHFWKFRCRKSERRRGAKHIFQVNSVKNSPSQTIFVASSDVEKMRAVLARSTSPSQNVTRGADYF